MPKRLLALIALPLATVFLVAGCANLASSDSGNTMTLEESTAAMMADIDDVQGIVGGEWVSDGGAERSCAAGSTSGVRVSENTYADGDIDREEVIRLVKQYWQSLGYETRERTDETPAIVDRIFATTASGSEMEFDAFDRGMALTVLSACAAE